MNKLFSLGFALLIAVPTGAQAQGLFALPSFKTFKLSQPVGNRPAVTKVPLVKTLETFRKTRVVVPLGDKDYHLAIQLTRADMWVLTLVPEGKNKFDLEGSFLFLELRKGTEKTFGGRKYKITLNESGPADRHAVRFQALDNPLGGMSVPVSILKRGIWEKGIPLPSIGKDWRLLFQIDLWRGAGMRSFTFLHRTPKGIEFYRTGAEAVDWERPIIREVGGIRVSMIIDPEDGTLHVRPAPEEETPGL